MITQAALKSCLFHPESACVCDLHYKIMNADKSTDSFATLLIYSNLV